MHYFWTDTGFECLNTFQSQLNNHVKCMSLFNACWGMRNNSKLKLVVWSCTLVSCSIVLLSIYLSNPKLKGWSKQANWVLIIADLLIYEWSYYLIQELFWPFSPYWFSGLGKYYKQAGIIVCFQSEQSQKTTQSVHRVSQYNTKKIIELLGWISTSFHTCTEYTVGWACPQ